MLFCACLYEARTGFLSVGFVDYGACTNLTGVSDQYSSSMFDCTDSEATVSYYAGDSCSGDAVSSDQRTNNSCSDSETSRCMEGETRKKNKLVQRQYGQCQGVYARQIHVGPWSSMPPLLGGPRHESSGKSSCYTPGTGYQVCRIPVCSLGWSDLEKIVPRRVSQNV